MLLSRSRLRTLLAASVLVGGVAVAGASAASAAAATTITLNPSDVVFAGDPLTATGTCAPGSLSAVVTLTQNGSIVDQISTNLSPSQGYNVNLDTSSGNTGLASANVDCFKYAGAAPIDSASATVAIDAGPPFTPIDVTVTPGKVQIGKQITVNATCPAGTTTAEVLMGSGNNSQAFLDKTVTPAADGTVTLTATITAGPLVQTGDAGAVVVCGTQANPSGLGFAPFRILAAPAVAPVASHAPGPKAPADPPAASAVPVLASTGINGMPATATALALVGMGLLLQLTRRRLQRG
jgi:hypothetical protein